MSFVTNKKAKRHFFHYVHISAWQKSLHRYCYFFLTLSIVVSFQTFNDFLLVKELPKALKEFSLQKRLYHACRCILVNGLPTKVLNFLKTEPNFQYVIKWNTTKVKIGHTFAHVWCLCSKLCNVSDEQFLFDVSIYSILWCCQGRLY